MNQALLLDYHNELCTKALDLMEKKNNDYGGNDTPFRNFEVAPQLGIASVPQGMLIRMADKLSRLTNFTVNSKDIKVTDESFEDTILDLINYAVLLAAWRKMDTEIQELTINDLPKQKL